MPWGLSSQPCSNIIETTVMIVMLRVLHVVPAEEDPKQLRQETLRSYLGTRIGHNRARRSQKVWGEAQG
jgi:hypothetical protein